MDGQGGLGKSGNLKSIAMVGSLQKIYLFCSRGGKDVLSNEIV